MLVENDKKNDKNTELDFENLKSGFANMSKRSSESFEESGESDVKNKANGKYSFFIVLAIFLLVNTLAVLLFVFDIGGLRTKLIIYQSTATDNRIIQERFESTRLELDAERASITEERARLTEKENVLTKKEQELDALEFELGSREKSLNELEARLTATDTGTEEARLEFAEIIKIYEKMESAKAAEIISAVEMTQRVKIIKGMKQAKASEILAAMDPAVSAGIMKELME